jgi:serine/threonine-protein kinase
MRCFLAAGLWAAVSAAAPLSAAAPEPPLADRAIAVLKTNCGRCHGPGGTNEDGINYILDPKLLAANEKIIPGDPAKSKLIRLVSKGVMPPEEEKPRPSKDDIALLEAWVKAGAPAPAVSASTRTFKTTKDILAAIRGHQLRLAAADRRFHRYFTLTHLWNNPAIADADLRLYRAALSKAINSLSLRPTILVPEAVDAEQTVFTVDLRRLDWDRNRIWNEVLTHYPYGLTHDHDPDPAVQALAREVYDHTGTDLPSVRADWFVAAATRPPLYHHLLFTALYRLPPPMTAAQLEERLGIDVPANFRAGKLARAGFTKSGVSGQNRLVERHESPFGAYWKSYDFKSNDGTGNLFRYPLGPDFADHPYPNQAFRHDGGEIVFNLPNGLNGYLLINGKDERIDEGPIEVVSDSLRTSGTAKIVNGLSCMACHKHGVITEFSDTVREGTAAQGEARNAVHRLYPLPETMKHLLQQDVDRFTAALEKATGPFLKVGPDAGKDIKDFEEPVGKVARAYLLKEVSAADAAYELGLSDLKLLQTAIKANDRLRILGMSPLARGGSVKREAWETMEGLISPFQEAASVLEVGTPKQVR